VIIINTVGHAIELISTLNKLWKILRLHIFTNPRNLTSEIHVIGYSFFIRSKNSVHLKDFKPRGMTWIYHKGMTSVTRVTLYLSWATL
jgi:hypothetical protein